LKKLLLSIQLLADSSPGQHNIDREEPFAAICFKLGLHMHMRGIVHLVVHARSCNWLLSEHGAE